MSDNKSENNNQTVSLAEHLSSVFDGEAGSFEQRRVLDELKSTDAKDSASENLKNKLSHFSLIGEAMRSNQASVLAGSDFLAGIHEKIDIDDEYNVVQLADLQKKSRNNQLDSANDGRVQKSLMQPFGGLALAASFAAMAFLGIQNYQLNNKVAEQSATIIAANKASQLASSQVLAVASSEKMKKVEQGKEEYRQANVHARSFLKRYVDSHIQYASTSTFVPSVRVIAYADY